jgi:hypothetical protein
MSTHQPPRFCCINSTAGGEEVFNEIAQLIPVATLDDLQARANRRQNDRRGSADAGNADLALESGGQAVILIGEFQTHARLRSQRQRDWLQVL